MTIIQAKTYSQGKFEEAANKMLFNVWIQKPDSSILSFVKKYAPALVAEPEGWRVHLSMTTERMPESLTIHSLTFVHHPFINFAFSQGQIDFLTRETKNAIVGIRDIHLWFIFDNINNADSAFTTLVEMFEKLSTTRNITTDGLIKTAEFVDENSNSHANRVEFKLVEDEIHKNKYKLFFRLGMDVDE